MIYWKDCITACGFGSSGITLLDGKNDRDGHNVSIELREGYILFREKCDGKYSVSLTPEEAIKALEEAIRYIKDKTIPIKCEQQLKT